MERLSCVDPTTVSAIPSALEQIWPCRVILSGAEMVRPLYPFINQESGVLICSKHLFLCQYLSLREYN